MDVTDFQLVLENTKEFYERYIKGKSSRERFGVIDIWIIKLWPNRVINGYMKWAMVDYFDERYYNELYTNSARFRPGFFGPKPPPVIVELNLTETEEISMSKTFFESKKFLQGKDVATLTNDEIYAVITAKEAEIQRLKNIGTKPKRLVQEIADHEADLQKLINFLDAE